MNAITRWEEPIVEASIVSAIEAAKLEAAGYVAVDAESFRAASSCIAELKRLKIAIEEGRKAAKSPILSWGRDIDRQAATLVESIDRVYGPLLRRISDFQAAQKRIAEEAARLRAEEIAKAQRAAQAAADLVPASAEDAEVRSELVDEALQRMDAAEAIVIAEPPKGAVGERARWVLHIDNPDAVPRAWCVPDEKRILHAMKAGIQIEGCRLVNEPITVVRGR